MAKKKSKRNEMASIFLKAVGNTEASQVSNGTIYDCKGFLNTGCLALNAQLSASIYGGLGSNRVTAIAGEESTGKTFMLLGFIKEFLESNGEDAMVAFFESEGAVNLETFEKRGINPEQILLYPVESAQDFKKQVTKFLDKYEKLPKEDRIPMFMCLDSLGMLPSDKEVQDALEDKDTVDMTRAKVIKSTFRIITIKTALLNIPFIFTNHIYSTLSQYSPAEMGGGSGLKYSASTIIYLTKAQYKEKNKKISKGKEVTAEDHAGILVTSNLQKSRETRQKTQIKFPITIEYGVSKYAGLFDLCYEVLGILFQTGKGRYGFKGDEKSFTKKQIESELFFTKEREAILEAACNKYFAFGNADAELAEELDDEQDALSEALDD